MTDDTLEENIEAEAQALVEEMEAEVDASSGSVGSDTDQDGFPDTRGRLKTDRSSEPSYREPPTIDPHASSEQPSATNEAYYEKEVGIDSVEIAGSTSVGFPNEREGKYERLERRQYQTDDEYSSWLSELDTKRITQALCSHLDLTPRQQDLIVQRMMELNLARFGSQKRIENVALAVVREVVEADHRPDVDPEQLGELSEEEIERLNKSWKRMSSDEKYNALLEQFDLDLNDIQRITKVLREQ